ncbi:MAG: alanyl-tRNA editing protein [Myxococcota bacterium]|nr:alanyl-tRNA editing protein [Myxococcota bacterium]
MELLQCHYDSYCHTLPVHVLSCERDGAIHRAVLDASIFYPGGGGQPQDRGALNGIPIRAASDLDGHPVVELDAPVAVGAAVQTIDWPYRFELMQQHTGQHLLTALALDLFGWQTQAFHLNEVRSDIVLDQPSMEVDDIMALESAVNDAIRAGHRVQPTMMDASHMSAPDIRVGRLPTAASGRLRVMCIAGIDQNPCGGTHVRTTAELQMLRLLNVESNRGASRLHFVVGERVRTTHREMVHREQALNRLLSSTSAAHVETVRRIQSREKALSKEVVRLKNAWAETYAQMLIHEAHAIGCLYREEFDMVMIGQMANHLQKQAPDRLFVLAGGPATEGIFVMVGPEHVVEQSRSVVFNHLAGRGGGRGGRVQGKVNRPAAVMTLAEVIESPSPMGVDDV